jgi:hypothetical protein
VEGSQVFREEMSAMRRKGRGRFGVFGAFIGLWLVHGVSAGGQKDHPYRYSVVDMPVSLAIGTVRTPEFTAAATHGYWIMVQVEKPFPIRQMNCLMGTTSGPLELKDCTANDPALRADWTVLNQGHVVSNGSSTTTNHGRWSKENVFKFVGSFAAQAGKKYVVEVTLTKDGSALNVANPHLIVVKQGEE